MTRRSDDIRSMAEIIAIASVSTHTRTNSRVQHTFEAALCACGHARREHASLIYQCEGAMPPAEPDGSMARRATCDCQRFTEAA